MVVEVKEKINFEVELTVGYKASSTGCSRRSKVLAVKLRGKRILQISYLFFIDYCLIVIKHHIVWNIDFVRSW